MTFQDYHISKHCYCGIARQDLYKKVAYYQILVIFKILDCLFIDEMEHTLCWFRYSELSKFYKIGEDEHCVQGKSKQTPLIE